MRTEFSRAFSTRHGSMNILGVTVFFDEDRDERVIPVVNALQTSLDYHGFRGMLLAVGEHEGTLRVQLRNFCSDWSELHELITQLVSKLSDLIVLDCWHTEFVR